MSRLAVVFALVSTLGSASIAATAAGPAVNPAADLPFETRIKNLESGLRCLVCQNQTLADSSASLADDLRREVRSLALAGKSDDEIRSYLVARYGDFVLYKPPLQANTALLWLSPFALLAGGAGLWWLLLRRRAATVGVLETDDDAARMRGRTLLDSGLAKAGDDEPQAADRTT